MAKFLVFLIRLSNLYLYFVVMACFLSFIPNINPNYPLFDYIFKIAGFYLIPPIFGILLSPMLMLITLTLIIIGLTKIYDKYYAQKESEIIIMTSEDFSKKLDSLKNKEKEPQNERKDNEQ